MIKIEMTGKVKKNYSEDRNGYHFNYLVVVEDGESKYPNILRFKSKNEINAASGDAVKVEAFVDGREYEGPKGTSYFTDLNMSKITVTASAEKTDDTPKYSATAKDALRAYLDNGGDKAEFGLFCKRITGKASSKEYGCDDWARVIAEACKTKDEAGDDLAADDDDLPF